jgi:hypothetical protein
MKRLGVALSLIFAALFAAAAVAGERVKPRAVIELFTSQGCSSCPAADKLMGELANDPSLIVMSLAIDYWDYLGWKDTLALPGHAGRQRAYSKVRGDREVYTPQVVVNGVTQAIGNDKAAIEKAMTQSRRDEALTLPVKLSLGGDQLTVSVPAGDERTTGEIWLCPMSRHVPVVIERGENRGKTVTYHNIVRRWVRLGDWNGEARTITVPVADFASPGVDEVAVVVQAGTAKRPGTMLGAAQIATR